LLCALACFTVLPALMMILDRRKPVVRGQWSVVREDSSRAPAFTAHSPLATDHCWLPWIGRRPGGIIAAGLLVTIALGSAAAFVRYDHNLLHLQAKDLDAVKWELKLIKHTAGASWHALSCTASAEEALALKRRYEELHDDVERVVEVASL